MRVFGRAWLIALYACGLGCGGASNSATGSGNGSGGGGSTGTTGTATDATTFGDPDTCDATAQCPGGHCVAPYDPGAGPGATQGQAACVPRCVPEQALDRWCIDDDACCANLTCDPLDGLCRGAVGTSGSTNGVGDWGTVSGAISSETAGAASSGGATSGSSTTGGHGESTTVD